MSVVIVAVLCFAVGWLARTVQREHAPSPVEPLKLSGPVCPACGAVTASTRPGATYPSDVIDIPRDIVEGLIEHLGRLEVLERREQIRIVRRQHVPRSVAR